jgi:predicted phage baseplate assembly protein
VNEVLGSGDARLANVRLPLRQGPLTYLSSAASASGRRSTLELRVNDLLWQEVPSLYGRGGNERVYALEWDASAGTRAMTGDGQEGGRLASGDHNLRARYRKGLGLAGNVQAGSLTTLLSRPLGVSEVVNPEPAEGGEDPEPIERLRQQAPLTVRTLDRAVSLRDYRDFAQAFPGIAKAHALWIAHGPCRGVFLTVAGEQGKAVSSHQAVYVNLLKALRRYGDPLVTLHLRSFDPLAGRFRLRLRLKVAADAETEVVKVAVAAALGGSFGFEARRFGQAVWLDEVAAVVQAVAGVEASLIAALHRSDRPVSRENPLRPTPILNAAGGPPRAAELLLLEPGALVLETLP